MLEPPRDPSNLPGIIVALITVWGAMVSYVSRTKFQGVPLSTLFFGFVKELIICSFAGFLIYALCMIGNVTGWAMAFLVAVGSHMGTRAIGLSEAILKGKLKLNFTSTGKGTGDELSGD